MSTLNSKRFKSHQNTHIFVLGVCIWICISWGSFSLAQNQSLIVDTGTGLNKNSIPSNAATLHYLIVIDSNSKFTPENGVVSGTGTLNDPFLIANWLINTTANNIGINIANTDAFVKITNCIFTNGSFGIVIENAKNVIITNNLFENITSMNGNQNPPNNTNGESGWLVTAIYVYNGTNVEISNNIIRNLQGGNGGPAGNATTVSPYDGGSSAGFIGMNVRYSQSIRVKNNFLVNLTGGNGGRGSHGINSTSGSAADGGEGGSAGSSYGMYFQSNTNLQIENNIMNSLTGGAGGPGGNGGNTTFSGAYGGDGGKSGYGGDIDGMVLFECENIRVENNSIEDVKAGTAGLSGNGGKCLVGTGGNGGDGNRGGISLGLVIANTKSILVTFNTLSNITSGNGGKGGNRGTYITSGTNGISGPGGDSGQAHIIQLMNSEGIVVKYNTFTLLNVGNVGSGGVGAVSGESMGPSCGLYYTNNQNSSFLYNNMFESQNYVNDLTKFSDGWYGNYWSAYTGIDTSRPKDGVGDTSYIVNGTYVDITPLIYPSNLDSDGDGLMNWQEIEYMTNMVSRDSDGDLIPDPWEISHGLDPTNILDGDIDLDGDQLPNYAEYCYGTDPYIADTNGDGFTDLENFQNKTTTNTADNNTDTDSDSDPLTPVITPSWVETYQVLILGGGLILGILLHGFIVRPRIQPQILAENSFAAGSQDSKNITNKDLKASLVVEKKPNENPLKKTETSAKKSP